MGALRTFADIVLLNVLFCALCLPVVTMGPALTALHSSMQLLSAGRNSDGNEAIREFFKEFKRSFFKSIGLFVVVIAVIIFIFIYHAVVWKLDGAVGRLYRMTFFLLIFVLAAFMQYIFPIAARFQLGVLGIIRNSLLLAIAAAPWTILALAVPMAAVYISFFMNPAGFRIAIFLWAVCGFGLVAYLDSFIFLKAFKKLGVELKAVSEDDGKILDGALFTDEEHRNDKNSMEITDRESMPDWNKRNL